MEEVLTSVVGTQRYVAPEVLKRPVTWSKSLERGADFLGVVQYGGMFFFLFF